jgi:hypothetical protein
MKERLDTHHSRAEQAESRYKSRRNYARLQLGLMKQKIISIAQERVEEEDDEAVEEEANQILDEPMGTHWREDGKVVISGDHEAVWYVTASEPIWIKGQRRFDRDAIFAHVRSNVGRK